MPIPGPRGSSLRGDQASASTGDLRLRLPKARGVIPHPSGAMGPPHWSPCPPGPPGIAPAPARLARANTNEGIVTIYDGDEGGAHATDLMRAWVPKRSSRGEEGPLVSAPGAYDALGRAASDAGQSSLASSLYRSASDASTAWSSDLPSHRRSLRRRLTGVQQDFFLPHLRLTHTQRATLLISLSDDVFVACQRAYRRGLGDLVGERLASRWRDDLSHEAQIDVYAMATRVRLSPGGQGLWRLARFLRWALGEPIAEPADVEARMVHIEALNGEEISGLLMPCGLSAAQEGLLHKHCGAAGPTSSVGSVGAAVGRRSPPASPWGGVAF